MEVLLDSSFIISCVRKRIDFLEQLEDMGFRVFLPREVFQELKDLKIDNRQSRADREAISVAFSMFEQRKTKKKGIGGRTVDSGLIDKGKSGIYIATLDNGIKREIPNKIVIFASKNSVGVERS